MTSTVFAQVRHIALFWGLEALGEPSTEELFDAVIQRGGRVALPRVDGNELDFRNICSRSELVAGYRGILEPRTSAPLTSLGELELIVVPGVAFGSHGERLGRGGGYYDRFLARPEVDAPAIGWAYSFQQIDEIPMAVHDCHVNGVATERGLVLYPPAQ